MARTRRSLPSTTTDSVVAAGVPLSPRSPIGNEYGRNISDYMINQSDGLDEVAWGYFRTIPELHYIVTLMGNALSQVSLYVGETNPDDSSAPTPVGPRHPAKALLRDYAGGEQGQSELLNRLAVQLTVSGDSVVVGPGPQAGFVKYPYDNWNVYSISEVSSRNGKIYLKGPNFRDETIPPGTMAIRIWRKSPQEWWKADSPVKSSLSVLNELDLINKHIQATTMSRLKTAGVFAVAEEFTLPNAEVEIEGIDGDPFSAILTEVFEMAIKNPGSAAALVPIILRGPAEFIQSGIRQIDFSNDFDGMIIELRNNAIRRLALGLDAPPEVLLGSAESSSWSMWQISESQLRLHIRPLAYLIADSLTEGWLRPALNDLPLADQTRESIERVGIYPDFSALQIRPDVGQDASALYDSLEIAGDTYRHVLGLGEAEKPTPEELEYMVYLMTIKSNPAMSAWAIKGLSEHFDIPFIDPEGAAAVGAAPVEEQGTPPAPTQPGTAPKIPGDRSTQRQTAAPKAPPADGDANNNESNRPKVESLRLRVEAFHYCDRHNCDDHGNWADFVDVDSDGLDRLNSDTETEIVSTVSRLQQKYRTKIRVVVSDEPNDNDAAWVDMDEPRVLKISPEFEVRAQAVIRDTDFRSESIADVITHEFGHNLAFLAGEDQEYLSEFVDLITAPGGRELFLTQVSRYPMSNKIVGGAAQRTTEAVSEAFLQFEQSSLESKPYEDSSAWSVLVGETFLGED